MKKILILTALFLAALSTSFAKDAPATKLKLSGVLELNAALTSLDGAERIVPQAEGQPARIVRVAYDFSGKTRLAIARNLGAVRAPVEAFRQAQQDIVRQVSPDGRPDSIDKDPALAAKYSALMADALKQPIELTVVKIPEADLRLDANPIPATVLATLEPLLTP